MHMDRWIQFIRQFIYFRSGHVTGHYTQVVWGDTCLVGCGFRNFIETKGGTDWNKKLYGCNYATAGNVRTLKMYSRGPPCSKCPGNSSCKDGLCVQK